MQTDYLQFVFQAIRQLLTANLGFFDAMGQNLFRAFATILIVWFGVKSALAAAGGTHPFHFDNFASLLLTISFGFAMVNYYSNPIPGIGTSFHNLITNEAQFLATKINQAELQTVTERVADFESRMDPPAIAAFIVPKLEWLFWGWFRCFLQYAFYQVIAAAVVFIIGNLILGILNLQPTGTISTVQLLGWFPVLLITFVASIYVLLRVPALTNHIFSGTSGGSSAQILQDFLA